MFGMPESSAQQCNHANVLLSFTEFSLRSFYRESVRRLPPIHHNGKAAPTPVQGSLWNLRLLRAYWPFILAGGTRLPLNWSEEKASCPLMMCTTNSKTSSTLHFQPRASHSFSQLYGNSASLAMDSAHAWLDGIEAQRWIIKTCLPIWRLETLLYLPRNALCPPQ